MTGAARRTLVAALAGACLLALAGCGGKKDARSAAEISAEASFKRAAELLARRDLRQAMTALKRIQFAPASRDEFEPLTRLALADATFYQGTAIAWIDARNLYLDFVTLNADHPLAPYAQLQVGHCSLEQVSQPSKDQALTLQAIRDLEAVAHRWPDSPYVEAARAMLREARANLAEAEYLVGRFYLKKKNYAAATERLKGIVIRFPDFPALEKVLFHLGQAYAKNGEDALARSYLARLLAEHPGGEFVAEANRILESMSGGFHGEVGSE